MKKEIKRIQEILNEYDKVMKKISLYRKYLTCMENGDEISISKIDDTETYALAKEIYRQGKIEELNKTIEKEKMKYNKCLTSNFEKLEFDLGSDFIDRCIKNIEEGDLEQVQSELRKKEERIVEKRIMDDNYINTYDEKVTLDEARRKKPFLTKYFGVKKEKYIPDIKIFKPNIKKDLEDVIITLEKIEEVTRKSDLYNKYINLFKNGKEMHPLAIEDTDVYDIAKEVYKAGDKMIAKFEEHNDDRKNCYIQSLPTQFADLKNRLDPKFVEKCIKDIKEGQVDKVKDTLLDMKNRIKLKTIRNYADCKDNGEITLFRRAKEKSPIKTFIFGVEVEVIEDKDVEKSESRKRVDVEKVDISEVKINDTQISESRRNINYSR